ncbi:hypothetical protein KEM55_002040 [Ascosphaera atra]|nr:hypothetical protein KEM55_002040 [Ascosphaera atra]
MILGAETENEETRRVRVIGHALRLLKGVHSVYSIPISTEEISDQTGATGTESSIKKNQDPALEDARRRRALHALLDLISLEGIYPSLSPGVAIPLEKRVISVLPAGVVAKQDQPTPEDASKRPSAERLLALITSELGAILRDPAEGIQQLILNRSLPDIISASAEVAFNCSTLSPFEFNQSETVFNYVISKSSTSSLLPVLSSFLQTSPVPWFKSQISSKLSHIPLRPDGVIQTVVFLASQFAPTLGQQDQGTGLTGPPITVQAIMQTSRLLSSVPADVRPEQYFENVAPKLFALLDGNDADLKKTASYVIGNGILGKKIYGAPMTVGYEIFARPLLDAINGVASESVQKWLRTFALDGTSGPVKPRQEADIVLQTVITEPQFTLAVDRLSYLVMLHPNPTLLRRLVYPALVPLWGLLCYSKEHNKASWEDRAFRLLHMFFSISADTKRYELLVDNILWDGGKGGSWVYAPGEEGGISIRKRPAGDEANDIMNMIDRVEERIDSFLKLLAADPQNDEVTGDVFLHASRKWLVSESSDTKRRGPATSTLASASPLDSGIGPMLKKLVSAKLTEKLLDKFKDSLSRHPTKVLEVIRQLVESELVSIEKGEHTRRKGPSLSSLSSIVEQADDILGEPDSDATQDTTESLSAAFSLLSTILSSPSFSLTEDIRPLLTDIRTKLDTILPKLPASLMQAATTSSVLLEITLTDAAGANKETALEPKQAAAASSRENDLQTHRQALQNLESDLPPVQAEGLTLLTKLISTGSPILDIPSTLTLLLSLITTTSPSSDDEFIYLNVIKAIGLTASRHPRTVIKRLAEAYADRDEQLTLDQRLRIGEALLSTVQGLGKALVGETARVLGETMLAIAGRRTKKPKARSQREEEAKAQARANLTKSKSKSRNGKDRDAEEDEALDRKVEQHMDALKNADQDDEEKEDPAVAAHSASILEAWARGAAADEQPDDLRARASAVSVLASAVQTTSS